MDDEPKRYNDLIVQARDPFEYGMRTNEEVIRDVLLKNTVGKQEHIQETRSLRRDYNDSHRTLCRLSELLTQTANALKGPPGPLSLHDWSDLPKVAARVKKQNGRLKTVKWKYDSLNK